MDMGGAGVLELIIAAGWLAVAYLVWRREFSKLILVLGGVALLGALLTGAAGQWLLAAVQIVAVLAAVFHFSGGRFSTAPDDESSGIATALPGLDAQSRRHLIGQGMWIDAKQGEVLTTEGKAVDNLFYLKSGGARVVAGGVDVGRCDAGSFVGDVTVLSGEPATATVVVDGPARLWCIAADRLRDTVRLHDDVRAAIDTAIRHSLTAKLVAANKAAQAR